MIDQPVIFAPTTLFWHPRCGASPLLFPASATTTRTPWYSIPSRNMIHMRIPSLRATAALAFPKTFLDQFAAVKMFQLRISALRWINCLLTEKSPLQRITLLRQNTAQSLVALHWATGEDHSLPANKPRAFLT